MSSLIIATASCPVRHAASCVMYVTTQKSGNGVILIFCNVQRGFMPACHKRIVQNTVCCE